MTTFKQVLIIAITIDTLLASTGPDKSIRSENSFWMLFNNDESNCEGPKDAHDDFCCILALLKILKSWTLINFFSSFDKKKLPEMGSTWWIWAAIFSRALLVKLSGVGVNASYFFQDSLYSRPYSAGFRRGQPITRVGRFPDHLLVTIRWLLLF